MQNSASRFSNRVDDYVKYRPHYPPEMISSLEQKALLKPGMRVADIGSGTGISSIPFLEKGYAVTGVEPNLEMRRKSEELLQHYLLFSAVNGTAEHTTLTSHSANLIIAGQSFHWFNRNETRAEFERIIQPGGAVVLVWNERLMNSPFEQAYDQLIIQHGKQYKEINHRNIDIAAIEQFFHPNQVTLEIFPQQQVFDYNELEGRLLSSSYMPSREDTGYNALAIDLKKLFDRFQLNGHIAIHYETKMYWGHFN